MYIEKYTYIYTYTPTYKGTYYAHQGDVNFLVLFFKLFFIKNLEIEIEIILH